MVQAKSTCRPSCSLAVALPLLSLVLGGAMPTRGWAQASDDSASVEQLTAMLQTIDPYRPLGRAAGPIQVFGSTSMDAMAHGWVNGFKQFHPEADVKISAANSKAAMERLLASPAGIALLSRPVKEAEIVELKKNGLKNPTAFVVAREALGVFVHPSNPVHHISGEQLRAVFTADHPAGELTWGLLGATGEWSKRPIDVISRSENSGTQMFLHDFVFQNAEMRDGHVALDSNAQVVGAVIKNPQSIAICGMHCGDNPAKALQLTAGARFIPSDDHAVLSGQYPLTRPLSLIIDLGQESPQAKASQELVRYALCQSGQTQAILAGFFPVDLPLLRAGLQKLNVQQPN